MITLPPLSRARRPFLRLRLVLPWVILLALLLVPIAGWLDLWDVGAWKHSGIAWGNPGLIFLAYSCGSLLLCLPLYWVVRTRAIDFVSLWLGQEALGYFGYLFIDQTATNIPQDETSILATAGVLLLINAAGLGMFLLSIGAGWGLTAVFRFPLAPLPAPPADLDRRLHLLLRFMGLFCLSAIALPMVLSQHIPLLSDNGAETRLEFANVSDTGRALYNMSSGLLPFVIGGLTVFVCRSPRRFLGWDGLLLLSIPVAQILTSNRSPLLFAMAIALCLLTLSFRWPRWCIALAFLSYVFSIVFLGGFTSLLRNSPRSLLSPDWFSRSIEESFLGDNIIDFRDGSWVFSHWDFQPLLGKTYESGLVSWVPSGILPEKKEWNIGLVGVRMVGMSDQEHFGLRITSYGESFLNFGWVGVFFMGILFGSLYGVLRRQLQLGGTERRCLWWGMVLMLFMQCATTLTNTGDAFTSWSLLGFLALIWLTVTYPAKRAVRKAEQDASEPETLSLAARGARLPRRRA